MSKDHIERVLYEIVVTPDGLAARFPETLPGTLMLALPTMMRLDARRLEEQLETDDDE